MRWWLADRYPLFKENFAGNTAELEQLIVACQARGLHPVLLELPLNLPIVRHAFDKPRKGIATAAGPWPRSTASRRSTS